MSVNPIQLRGEARVFADVSERLKALGLDEDEQTFADTLEGASDFQEVAIAALRDAKMRETQAEACKAYAGDIMKRAKRLTEGADRIRAIVAEAMEEAGAKSIKSADMTVSLTARKPRLVFDEDRIGQEFKVAVVTYKLDKGAIKAAVDRGDVPEGVQIANGSPSLRILTK